MIEARGRMFSVIRLEDGEDVVAQLREQRAPAVIVGGIGMLRDVTLGYWNGSGYETREVVDPAELLSMQGTIGAGPDGPVLHAHLAVARRDGSVAGGHLVAARVANTAEVVLAHPEGIALERRPEASGLMGLYPRSVT